MRPLPFAVCLAVLLYGMFRPESPPELFEQSDKLLHLLAFGALALSARLAFPRFPSGLLWGTLLALAPFLEWLQHYLQSGRQFSELDIAANLVGVALAWLGWRFLQLLRQRFPGSC